MATLTAAGITPTDLTGYVERLEQALMNALGADLNLAPETPQGQLAGEFGIVFTESDELAVYVANGMNRETASGRQLDDFGTLFSIPRIQGERSTVAATLSGAAGTVIPVGSRVQTANRAVFATDASAIIAAGGTAVVLCRAVDFGPIAAPAGELNRLVTVISGWTGVTNTLAAKLGRDRETDAEYRRRYTGEVAVHARDGLEAVRARVLETDGVTDALVRDNTTTASVTVQGVDIDARSMLVIAEGGTDADVGAAIAATKPAGGLLTGNVSVNVPHAQGFNIAIDFRRVAPIAMAVAVSSAAGDGFPADGLAQMRANLLAWVAGTWDPGGTGFDRGGLAIGESLDTNRLLSPINAVPGHTVTTVTATRTGGAALGTPDLDERFTLATADVTLVLS